MQSCGLHAHCLTLPVSAAAAGVSLQSDYLVSLHMQSAFEDVLHAYGVDLFVAGHYHAYERTCAVYNQTCRPDGTMHVVCGASGFELDNTDWYPKDWSIRRLFEFGYGRLRIEADTQQQTTALTWQFVLNSNQTVWDEVTLTKPLPDPSLKPMDFADNDVSSAEPAAAAEA
jgi:hypothetical protein